MRSKTIQISRARLVLALSTTLLAPLALATACDDDDADEEADGGGEGAPAAPEMLTAEELSGGAHLTWVDASDNEDEFMIMKMDVTAGGEYEHVANVPFDTTQYHDAPLVSGNTYMFMVTAMNAAGSSDSEEIEFTMP